MDRSDFLSGYVDETGVTTQLVTSDKEAVRKAKTCLWEQFLVCTHLRGYSDTEREVREVFVDCGRTGCMEVYSVL